MNQKQVNIGPYIVTAAAIHAAMMVIGMLMIIEFQKFQLAWAVGNTMDNIQKAAKERELEKKRVPTKEDYDEPADRRGLK